MMMNKIEVAPVNTNIPADGRAPGARAGGGATPTSTTVMLPYRATDGAVTSGLFDMVPTAAASPKAGAVANGNNGANTGSTEGMEEGMEGVRRAFSQRDAQGDIESGEISGMRCASVAPGASDSATESDALAGKEESNKLVTTQE